MEVGQFGNIKPGIIIQARLDSKRLKGKVLMPFPFNSDSSMLDFIIKRVQNQSKVGTVIIATSKDKIDDPLEMAAISMGVASFRGDKDDVLCRFYEAAISYNLDVVFRLTGDNPFVFSELIDGVLKKHIEGNFDYTRLKGLPLGTSFEVVNTNALKKSIDCAPSISEREHVTLFIKKNPNLFKSQEIEYKINSSLLAVRFTIDYPSDYAAMSMIVDGINKKQIENIRKVDLVNYIQKNSWITSINRDNYQKIEYKSFIEEASAAKVILTKLGFNRIVSLIDKSINK